MLRSPSCELRHTDDGTNDCTCSCIARHGVIEALSTALYLHGGGSLRMIRGESMIGEGVLGQDRVWRFFQLSSAVSVVLAMTMLVHFG